MLDFLSIWPKIVQKQNCDQFSCGWYKPFATTSINTIPNAQSSQIAQDQYCGAQLFAVRPWRSLHLGPRSQRTFSKAKYLVFIHSKSCFHLQFELLSNWPHSPQVIDVQWLSFVSGTTLMAFAWWALKIRRVTIKHIYFILMGRRTLTQRPRMMLIVWILENVVPLAFVCLVYDLTFCVRRKLDTFSQVHVYL